MKAAIVLIVILFTLTPITPAQTTPQTPTSNHSQPQELTDKEQIAAMKNDLEKIRFSLAQMKANLLTLRDPNEVDRWRNNADMWEAMIDQMDHMLQFMDSRSFSPATPPPPPAKKHD